MLTISTSAIKTFWNDPTQFYIEFVLGRTLRRQPVALITGVQWHIFMENLLNGASRQGSIITMKNLFQDEIDMAISEDIPDRAKALAKDRDILVAAAELWTDQYDVETLAVEKALSLELQLPQGDSFKLVGRPDRVIRFGNRIGHYQHRTLAMGKPIGPYLEVFHRNAHETGYWKMLAQEYGEAPFGVILSVVRKLRPESIIARPGEALQQHLVPISEEQADAGVQNIIATVTAIKKMLDGELPMWFNPDNDLGRYGNSLSPYVRAFIRGGWDAFKDDGMFVDAKDRYADLVTD